MYWEIKKFVWLALLQYLLYCGSLELNMQCIWGMPVFIEWLTAFRSDQIRSVAQSCLTPCDPMNHSTWGFTITQSLLKFMSMESVVLSNHLILCNPLLSLPLIFPSIGVFSNKLALHIRWSKYWSLSSSISPSNDCSVPNSIKTQIATF